MYTIELLLKGNPASLSVQQKEEEAAQALYQTILTALKEQKETVLELTCDRTEKKVAIASQALCGVQLTPKSPTGAGTGQQRPGFFAQ